MLSAIAETEVDGKERGFHIFQDLDVIGRTPTQTGDAGHVELKLKHLPFLSTKFKLISFHTHNNGLSQPSSQDVTTSLALGENLLCIGYMKNNVPHITCWQVKTEKKFDV